MAYEQVPALWRTMGFTADDVNAANDYLWNVALPNAVKVTERCRQKGLPMIFIHWGCQFEDGMDLDPDVRKMLLNEHGTDYAKWGHHNSDAASCPAKVLGVRQGEYVLAKTAQDAFKSCSLDFVLLNLGVKRIVFIGGHTEACLGKTAKSAKERGYETLCVEDATFNARESTRKKGIEETDYNHVVTAAEFLSLSGTKP
jgi:nicotinamidase-related amidase